MACDNKKIVGCGGLAGYWGSKTESYLLSIFVSPEYQGMGIGKRIVQIPENDEYFARVWRTEVGSSITAVDFYRKLGYDYKNGITTSGEYDVIRLEKRNRKMNKRLYKSNQNKMVCGVCGGTAEYFDIDPTLVRLGWVLFCALGGSGILAYIIAAIVIPGRP